MELALTTALLSLLPGALQGSPPALPSNFSRTDDSVINWDSGRTNIMVPPEREPGFWGADKEGSVIKTGAPLLIALYLDGSPKELRHRGAGIHSPRTQRLHSSHPNPPARHILCCVALQQHQILPRCPAGPLPPSLSHHAWLSNPGPWSPPPPAQLLCTPQGGQVLPSRRGTCLAEPEKRAHERQGERRAGLQG